MKKNRLIQLMTRAAMGCVQFLLCIFRNDFDVPIPTAKSIHFPFSPSPSLRWISNKEKNGLKFDVKSGWECMNWRMNSSSARLALCSCSFSHHIEWINLKNETKSNRINKQICLSLSLREHKRKNRKEYNQISVWHIYCLCDNDAFRNSSCRFGLSTAQRHCICVHCHAWACQTCI